LLHFRRLNCRRWNNV